YMHHITSNIEEDSCETPRAASGRFEFAASAQRRVRMQNPEAGALVRSATVKYTQGMIESAERGGRSLGAVRSTLVDVAREAGVSTATVDRVLNNRAGPRSRTRELVLE